MLQISGEYTLECKSQAQNVETPKNCHCRRSGGVQGAMVGMVELKSLYVVLGSFSSSKCGKETS